MKYHKFNTTNVFPTHPQTLHHCNQLYSISLRSQFALAAVSRRLRQTSQIKVLILLILISIMLIQIKTQLYKIKLFLKQSASSVQGILGFCFKAQFLATVIKRSRTILARNLSKSVCNCKFTATI